MNLQPKSQSHVAHQSRRENLRASESADSRIDTPGFSDFPLDETSPSITRQAEQAQQTNETSSSAREYSAHPANTDIGDEMQAYEAHVMTSEMPNFPSGVELLGFPSKNPFLQEASGGDVSTSRPSVIGTSYQSLGNPACTVGNWKSLNGQQNRSNRAWPPSLMVPNSLQGLDPSGGYCGQNLSNSLVLEAGGMHVRSSGDELKEDIEAHASHADAEAMHLYLANQKYPRGFPETHTSANTLVTHPTNGIAAPGLEAHEKHLGELPLQFLTFSQNAVPFVSEVSTSAQTVRESSRIQWQSSGSGLAGSGNNMLHNNQHAFPQIINNPMSWNGRAGGSQSTQGQWNRGSFVGNKGVDGTLIGSRECMSAGPDRSGQALSLSLSSHQSSEMHLQDMGNHANVLHMGGETKEKTGGPLSGASTDGFGYLSSYSREVIPEKGILNSLQGIRSSMNGESLCPIFSGNYVSSLKSSRYFKVAQELLYEFCNMGKVNSPHNPAKQKTSKPQEWGGWPSMGYNVAHNSSNTRNEVAGKFEDGSTDQPLYSGDRFELQRRKAKLMSMLEEVDRRYKYYCDQMHLVVTSFESVTSVGSATPYTALGLKAMSRHFRCLRDAVIGQLQATSKALGERNSTVPGTTRGETPRLGFIDRSMRQQRALQQMGMMEQHPWRPQRGLPERSVSVLRAWLFEHFLHPYPTDADKHILAKQTGLSRSQVSNWFINARVRLWKPMVEEMYLEETKEAKMEVTPSKGEQNEERERFDRPTGTSSHEKNTYKHEGPDHNHSASQEVAFKLDHSCSTTSQTGKESSGCKTLHLQSEEKIDDMKEVEMNFIHESESLTSMNTSEADTRLEAAPGYRSNFDLEKRFRDDEFFTHKLQAVDHADTTLDFSSYNNNARPVTYSHEDIRHTRVASNGVSLTLGLRHSGGLSFPMVEDKYNNAIYFTREQDDDPNNQYNMLANQECQGNGFILDQNLPYRNYANGSRLLHDFVG